MNVERRGENHIISLKCVFYPVSSFIMQCFGKVLPLHQTVPATASQSQRAVGQFSLLHFIVCVFVLLYDCGILISELPDVRFLC